VSEPILPTAPSGWTFGTPSISGSPATIIKGDQAIAVVVTVTNSITQLGVGCGYTWGYWKNHNKYQNQGGANRDPGWNKIGEDTQFFGNYANPPINSDTLTWYEILLIAPKGGNAYLTLAHQYVAAFLNIHKDTDPADPMSLGTAMADAEALLAYYSNSTVGHQMFPPVIPKGANRFTGDDRAWAIQLAGVLDQFNNGTLPSGPPHCGE
ncbi:MAG: hypothetical protein H6Q05_4074, partial [Acidobacteria bacterium]|nr:hypothetical protein [Acidobacteriota bacterium]